MKIKKNDTVLVISGKDKGTKGKVIAAFPKENKVIVEKVNIQTKHLKAKQDQPAEIIKTEGKIDVSNVMFYDEKSGKGVRVAYDVVDGKKVRVAAKTRNVLD